MYINHLMTDRELIDAAQYAENPHLRLMAERLEERIRLIQETKDAIDECELPDDENDVLYKVAEILNR